jgi:uncharacterized protein YdeI (YjbR/CyaY-like superfamily)
MKTNPKVDPYFIDGCGRCSLYKTPDCKVHTWPKELARLRKIILSCGLTEELKWSFPTYTFQNTNILILSAFKEYCSVNFCKGALLKDPKGILIQPGESTQAARQIRFTNIREVDNLEPVVKAYIKEAIEAEKAGLKVEFKKNPEPIPVELQNKLDAQPALKKAFESLTPGRQRGYIIYFSQPKQSKTREARIEKCIAQILAGKGMLDDYRSMKK